MQITEVPKIVAADVVKQIILPRYMKTICIPRFTPHRWWECDVFELSASGYFREYEVKLSRGDFFADAKKENVFYPKDWNWNNPKPDPKNKHQMLASGDPQAPCQFYFVTPKDMLKSWELPTWAGLIEITHQEYGGFNRMHLFEAKKAPRLHRVKMDLAINDQIRNCCYHRMHSLLSSYAR